MIRALLWKEWREQRWRFFLGTLVLVTLAAGLNRAQIVPMFEAMVIVFGPAAMLVTMLLAMGPVAPEREADTWRFITAQPLRVSTILRCKWAVGAATLLAMLLIAGAAGYWAAASRGVFDLPPIPAEARRVFMKEFGWSTDPEPTATWFWSIVGSSAIAMLASYSMLFFILMRARNELHAGLGAILMTVVLLLWLMHYPASNVETNMTQKLFAISFTCNPLGSIAAITKPFVYRIVLAVVALALWIAAPLALLRWLDRREQHA